MRGEMLAVGTKAELIRRFGDRFHVHLMMKSQFVGDAAREAAVRRWIESNSNLEGAVVEREMLHGQLRFWIPRRRRRRTMGRGASDESPTGGTHVRGDGRQERGEEGTLVTVFRELEAHKLALGIEYYSVVQTNLEDVFLNVVGQDEH
jgi:ATP-binding cassette, subfamily A (ABC1), member 3